jgi:cell fate regulator YaaT (PSP1 superfamily)
MSWSHVVRVGALGHVGRFLAVDATCYPRGSRVIVRTARGLEVGEVLAGRDRADSALDGSILRGMTLEDELLQARLQKNREAAYEGCRRRLRESNMPAVLMDVEHLFDGQTLIFYFLGEQPPGLEALTSELAEAYDAQAQFRAFAATVTAGCGPGCGTEHAEGPGCGACATGCAVADACASRGR